jgi:hypothetical protein
MAAPTDDAIGALHRQVELCIGLNPGPYLPQGGSIVERTGIIGDVMPEHSLSRASASTARDVNVGTGAKIK